MSTPAQKDEVPSAGRRAQLIFAAMVVLLVFSFTLGWALLSGLRDLDKPKEDVSWAIYQLGLEHQRLQLALETGAPLSDVRLRSSIYLSRVLLLKNAPAYASVRTGALGEGIVKLANAAKETERLIAGELSPAERTTLVSQTRLDSETVREMTLALTVLNRSQQAELRADNSRRLIYFLATLEGLLLVLLGFAAWLWWINKQLGRASQLLSFKAVDMDAILNAVDDGVVGIDSNDRVVYCSDRAASLMGWGELSVAGQSLRDLLSKGALNETLVDLLNALNSDGGAQDTDLARRHSIVEGDRIRHFELRGALASYGSQNAGQTLRIVTISDVTEQDEMQRNREEYDARLGEMSRLLTLATISGGIVHEISQPLSSIKNYIHILANSGHEMPADGRRYLKSLSDEVDRVVETVRNVRRMALDQHVEIGTCDLYEALRNSVRLATFGKPNDVKVNCPIPDGKLHVVGSLPLIGQVLVNLIKNAVEASGLAGADTVDVAVSSDGSFASITVRDYGRGVDPEFGARIFMPFSGQSEHGMGLGLAICKRIVDSLGGEIEWKNLKEGGAEFNFTIPVL